MHRATESSPNYDFRRNFDSITRPGLIRFLDTSADLLGDEFDADRQAGYAKAYVRTVWRALKSEQQDAEIREGVEPSPPMGSPAYIHPPWNAERATAIAAEFQADAIDAEKRGADTTPVDIDRAVRLATEMARKQNADGNLPFTIEIGPEAVAYARDRLKSKIERNAVYNPVTEVHAGLLSFRFLKEEGGRGNVVYIDHYKRQQPKPKPGGAEQEAEPKPEVGARKRDDLLLSSWLKRELPPRDYLLGDIMSTTSRWIIYGETGVGKTLFGMDMSGAIASGRGLLNWEGSGVPRRVMYLDGELPAETFKERMEIVARQYGADIELYGYCRDILGDGDMPPLNKPEGVKWLETECRTIQPEVIVFDSIMCLLTGNMAEEESWAPITPMLRQISQQRCAQIWLHHTGHDTSKGFGTKTREWQMDTVLSLTKDAQNDEHLLMEFKKARLRKPETREQFEPKKIVCNADGWAIVGGATKQRGPKSDESASLKRQILAAYERLADGADTMPGLNGKPVKKVRLFDEILRRGHTFVISSVTSTE